MALPARITAQDRSPNAGERHHAAVRAPPAEPSEWQVIGAERTTMCPEASCPFRPPNSRTNRSRASTPPTGGHGCDGLQLSSISRAATPAIRMRGPSAHHTGPSPSHTATGVQVKLAPAAMICAARAVITRSRPRHCRDQGGTHIPDRRAEPAPRRLPGPPSNLQTPGRMVNRSTELRNAWATGRTRKVHDGNDSRRSCGCYGSLRN